MARVRDVLRPQRRRNCRDEEKDDHQPGHSAAHQLRRDVDRYRERRREYRADSGRQRESTDGDGEHLDHLAVDLPDELESHRAPSE